MIFRKEPSGFCWNRTQGTLRAFPRPGRRVGSVVQKPRAFLFSLGVLLALQFPPAALCQDAAAGPAVEPPPSAARLVAPEIPSQLQGRSVASIAFEGVSAARLDPIPRQLAQTVGAILDSDKLKQSLRQLYATGLYNDIAVQASASGDGVALVFKGTPRLFIGTVGVDGAKGATINTQLNRASQLNPGTRFNTTKLNQALDEMRTTLALNGFHQPRIVDTLTPHPDQQLVDIAFHVTSGPQARIGSVQLTGDAGMNAEEFRRHAHLKIGARVDHDTVNRALAGVLKRYRSQDRLEAEIKVESQEYDPGSNRIAFRFSATEGPRVRVRIQGVNMDQERVRKVIPIYEEGTVDEDLLNEGNRRLRDFYQRLGYFDVKVGHQQLTSAAGEVEIVFNVNLGSSRRVDKVSIKGDHYFDKSTLQQLLAVHAADTLDRHGTYSQALVSSDVSALESVYRNNGFANVKVRSETSTPETGVVDNSLPAAEVKPGKPRRAAKSQMSKIAPLSVTYQIEEGEQQRVGAVSIEGAEHISPEKLTPLMNTAAGQLLSPHNLAGDRDAIVTAYLNQGFEHPQVDVTQKPDPSLPNHVDVVFRITEGQEVFVRNVLLTGLHYTRPETVARAITVRPGDPLSQNALLDTQRNLYEFALFNEVDPAIENPNGGDTRKTVLLQTVEARRWALTYGFGFEVQTGTPHYNCGLIILSGAVCNSQGKTGISPRVLADVTRNNLFGRELSASLQGNYGLLEQKISLLFQDPHLSLNRNFGFSFSGGYANSLDVTTYVASRLEGGFRLSEHFDAPGSRLSKANSFLYELTFRRVKVEADSLQVSPGEIAQESTAVRVAGPAVTWIRDTRDSVLDAHRGTYTSFQEFLSDKFAGAQATFNRLDVSNSSYWSFDKDRFVLARNTRYGQERSFGTTESELIPLPERLYAGGFTSLRGFSINAAGPRDPETGYPIGGAGAFINSTEARLPPPTLPYLGDSVSFVIFHDMGNVFTNASDVWPSAIRTRQPDRDTCKNLDIVNPSAPDQPPAGPVTSTGWQGQCNFNYFSHALGVGLRYHTPIGPIRLDFSYNLNTPIFPVIYNYSNPTAPPTVGEAAHFNFFFSLGQAF